MFRVYKGGGGGARAYFCAEHLKSGSKQINGQINGGSKWSTLKTQLVKYQTYGIC